MKSFLLVFLSVFATSGLALAGTSLDETRNSLNTNKNAVLCSYSDSVKSGIKQLNEAIGKIEEEFPNAVTFGGISTGRTTLSTKVYENLICVLVTKR